ncbi:type I restriction enzyme HsdR N-terminal domain-containing protein [Chondrinema litorale]|uniref:type I restriction enzyme HsdR N-terminal domain-containing protein n=1 Tax=Chondrinema litorale TaxID=2994555 RepID=UPI002543868D|nr:type I restriction enzyme HsdR N-terminal domain-containing protein [Chondrinema litorale]UZR93620.1 type I restriction enzyme HsdR N-terminal domain-containing protein [Chondrinema litorale]
MSNKLTLNLPSFDYKIKQENGRPYILDVIRKKYIILEPEEWVRQHFIHYMLTSGYPKSLLKIERGHKYNTMAKRSDILAFSREGTPYLLVECKSPDVPITQKVFEQVANYNRIIKAPFLAVTNGMEHYFCKINFETNSFQMLDNLPAYC